MTGTPTPTSVVNEVLAPSVAAEEPMTDRLVAVDQRPQCRRLSRRQGGLPVSSEPDGPLDDAGRLDQPTRRLHPGDPLELVGIRRPRRLSQWSIVGERLSPRSGWRTPTTHELRLRGHTPRVRDDDLLPSRAGWRGVGDDAVVAAQQAHVDADGPAQRLADDPHRVADLPVVADDQPLGCPQPTTAVSHHMCGLVGGVDVAWNQERGLQRLVVDRYQDHLVWVRLVAEQVHRRVNDVAEVARPGLDQALAAVRAGDELVVTTVDRLARSLSDLTRIVTELHGRGVRVNLGGVVYDPNDPVGKLLVTVLGMIAEFEADLIRQRTREGMAIARANGRLKGPPRKLSERQARHLVDLHRAGEHTVADLMDMFRVSRATVYRTLNDAAPEASTGDR